MTAPATLLASLSRRPATAEPDADLLGRFVTDADSAAFAELVHRYARLVWRVARTRCRSDTTAEDVFQATFAVLNRKAKAIRTPAALAGWLHLTAHRLAIRATRRERPTVQLPPDLPHAADPLDALTARELLAAVDDELAKLNDAERAVLLLCGLDGVSNGEAATRLGVSSGSVKGRLERARGKLRDRLSARGLTVPSVLVGLVGLAPPASAVDAAVLLPAGGVLPQAVATLISETFAMNALNAKTVLAAAVAGLLLLTGSVFTDTGVTPKADAAPRPQPRRNAPVPKDAKAVLWSEPVRVDWTGSGAARISGVWSPDGKSVLVPTPIPANQNELLIRGGVDFRDAATGKVTKSLPFARAGKFLFQPTAIRTDGTAVHAAGMVHESGKKAEAASTLITWLDAGAERGGKVRFMNGRWPGDIGLSPDGKRLAAAGPDDVVQIYETTAGRLLAATKVDAQLGRFTAPTFAGGGDYVAVATDAGAMFAFDAGTGRWLGTVGELGVKAHAVATSADGVLAVGGEPGEKGTALVTLAGAPKFEKLVEPQVFADAVPAKERINGLSFSPDGKHLAAACSDGVLRVFDVATGKAVVAAKEHKEELFGVAYSPDGKKLLTVGKDAIKVWDVAKLMAK